MFLFLKIKSNPTYIYFTKITKQVHITYICHARWQQWLRLGSLLLGEGRSTKREPTCPTWCPHDHLIVCVLQKGCGYHLDLLLVAILIVVNSLLGLPYFVAATVLSINHVMSLKKESSCTAPGERPKFLGVRYP